MKTHSCLAAALFVATVASGLSAPGKSAASDLLPLARRQATVDTAEKLAQRAVPPPVAAETPNPFAPANFDAPDPAAGRAGGPGNRATSGASSSGAPAGSAAQAPKPALGDREILEILAMRLPPAATFVREGKPLLVIGRDRFEVGTRFIVTYNDQDYELELVSIDRTTFTLRYRGEDYTRPIKPVK